MKPKGWHAFTAAQRPGEPALKTVQDKGHPPPADAYPELSSAGPHKEQSKNSWGANATTRGRSASPQGYKTVALPAGARSPGAVPKVQKRAAPVQQELTFGHQGLTCAHQGVTPVDQGSISVDRGLTATDSVAAIRQRVPDAEEALVEDVLAGVNGHEETALQLLYSMGLGRASPPEDHQSSEEEEVADSYYKYRKEALRVSRSRARHAHGAATAFQLGAHARARELSARARQEGQLAAAMHAKAAEQILKAHNEHREDGLWELDLHGLHAGEAVAALAARLEALEASLALAYEQAAQNSVPGGKLSGLQFGSARRELFVITGKGNHSRGGASLPNAVNNFLLESRYTSRQSRPGVIAVRPKQRHQRS